MPFAPLTGLSERGHSAANPEGCGPVVGGGVSQMNSSREAEGWFRAGGSWRQGAGAICSGFGGSSWEEISQEGISVNLVCSQIIPDCFPTVAHPGNYLSLPTACDS